MNVLTIAGRIGRDAETRYTQSGKAVTGFSVAVDQRVAGGEKSTLWIDCSVWGERVEKLAQYLIKGTSVAISGEAGVRCYTPKNGGEPKAELTLFVREVTLLGNKRDGESGGGARGRQNDNRESRMAPPAHDGFNDDIPFVTCNSVY